MTSTEPSTARLVAALWVAEPHHREALLGALAGVALQALLGESIDQPGPDWAAVVPHVLNEITERGRRSLDAEAEQMRDDGICSACLRERDDIDPARFLCGECSTALDDIRTRHDRHLGVVR